MKNFDYLENLTLEEKASEFEAVKAMLSELDSMKRRLEKEFKKLTKNGPIVLEDGRTVETVTTYRNIPNCDKIKECGLYEELYKTIPVNTLKIK